MLKTSKLALCGFAGLAIAVSAIPVSAGGRRGVATCAAPRWNRAPFCLYEQPGCDAPASPSESGPQCEAPSQPAESPPASSPSPTQREYYYAQPTVQEETVMVPQMQTVMVPQVVMVPQSQTVMVPQRVVRQGIQWQRGPAPAAPAASSPPASPPAAFSPPAFSSPAFQQPAFSSPSSCSGSSAVNQMLMMYMMKSMESRQPALAQQPAAASPTAGSAELVDRVNALEKKLDNLIETLRRK